VFQRKEQKNEGKGVTRFPKKVQEKEAAEHAEGKRALVQREQGIQE